SRVLRYISDDIISGNDVKMLEIYLDRLGIPVEYVNGKYDLFTLSSVKEFQRVFGLEIDGIFEKKDYQELLKQVDKLKFKETINDEYRRILKMKDWNMRGKDIEKLNNQLSKIYPTTKFSKDLYDQTTESMVKLFQ